MQDLNLAIDLEQRLDKMTEDKLSKVIDLLLDARHVKTYPDEKPDFGHPTHAASLLIAG
jgi:hypothetical protein